MIKKQRLYIIIILCVISSILSVVINVYFGNKSISKKTESNNIYKAKELDNTIYKKKIDKSEEADILLLNIDISFQNNFISEVYATIDNTTNNNYINQLFKVTFICDNGKQYNKYIELKELPANHKEQIMIQAVEDLSKTTKVVIVPVEKKDK